MCLEAQIRITDVEARYKGELGLLAAHHTLELRAAEELLQATLKNHAAEVDRKGKEDEAEQAARQSEREAMKVAAFTS